MLGSGIEVGEGGGPPGEPEPGEGPEGLPVGAVSGWRFGAGELGAAGVPGAGVSVEELVEGTTLLGAGPRGAGDGLGAGAGPLGALGALGKGEGIGEEELSAGLATGTD